MHDRERRVGRAATFAPKQSRRPAQPKSFIFYRGPSLLDGAPIVGIATGLRLYQGGRTENPKTGGEVVQTWILRADVAPHDALHSGEDASVCGDCPLRPLTAKGTGQPLCYATCSGGRAGIVNLWRSFRAKNMHFFMPSEAAALLAGRQVRIGSYGDPAAIPISVWTDMLAKAAGSIGYTHQWRTCDPKYSALVMASVETAEQREQAQRWGYRTFRIRAGGEGKMRGEVVCPGSAEAGRKLTCAQCRHCNGNQTGRRGDVVIIAH